VLGKEFLHQSKNVLDDIENKRDIKEIFQNRGKEGLKNIKHKIGERLLGSGRIKNPRKFAKSSHLTPKAQLAKFIKNQKLKKKSELKQKKRYKKKSINIFD
jgi:hypothetical protein